MLRCGSKFVNKELSPIIYTENDVILTPIENYCSPNFLLGLITCMLFTGSVTIADRRILKFMFDYYDSVWQPLLY